MIINCCTIAKQKQFMRNDGGGCCCCEKIELMKVKKPLKTSPKVSGAEETSKECHIKIIKCHESDKHDKWRFSDLIYSHFQAFWLFRRRRERGEGKW